MSAIIVEGLGKRYTITHQRRHDTLRDTLAHGARNLFSRLLPSAWRGAPPEHEDFWALRDVAFKVEPGEVVGIIGRNGAGKSTLLKILSRITEPTTGRITLNGRVASLLEVGTGFHPDLSGRENIFLNGAILGMRREEIRRKFDEIVAFSEVERFLDTPVKRYSSGMYMRLAFAVAAHLEPEILIVDEVLAVGDQQFQDKCLGKMRSIAGGGRTVLFVSHNMAAIQTLCIRALLMDAGAIQFDGLAAESVHRYLHRRTTLSMPQTFAGRDPALSLRDITFDRSDNTLRIDIVVRTSEPRRLAIEFILLTTSGIPIAFSDCGTLDISRRLEFPRGDTFLTAQIDASALANGPYFICTQLVDPFAHVLLRHQHSDPVEIARIPSSTTRRVLELSWQSGVVELPLSLRTHPAP